MPTTYTRTSIKQIVNILDPQPKKETAYEFSNGRSFVDKRTPWDLPVDPVVPDTEPVLVASTNLFAEYLPAISGSNGPTVITYANGAGTNLQVLSGVDRCQVNFVMPYRGSCNIRCQARRGAVSDSHRLRIYRNTTQLYFIGIGATFAQYALDGVTFEAGDNITIGCSSASDIAALQIVKILAEVNYV